jgi:hypothetical protein
MRILFFLLTIGCTQFAWSQLAGVHLSNALVLAQMENDEDRYTIEVCLTELFSNAKIKTIPSLNILKTGSPATLLASDSLLQAVKQKGIDTYVLVSVRGYDKKFRPGQCKDDFQTALGVANLYPIYREEIVSVSFEYLFYRNGQCIGSDVVKCGNVSDRDAVVKKFRKAMTKHIYKYWL